MSKLKAFVRYDSTGRVVAGSLILQKTKPKVGNWMEVESNLCCNPTTTTSSTTINPATTTTTTTSIQYQIGQYEFGGVIAYILQEGDAGYDPNVQHGIIVNEGWGDFRIAITAGWGCYGTNISGANGTAIGTGYQNTLDILAGCTDPDIAAYVCTHLNDYGYDDKGYTDWYLPSNDELLAIWQNKDVIGLTLPIGYIWSSTEFGSSDAYSLQNNGSLTFNYKDYNSNTYILAVRNF